MDIEFFFEMEVEAQRMMIGVMAIFDDPEGFLGFLDIDKFGLTN